MITKLERRLMDAFHEDAQRARLVHPDAPTTSAWLRLSDNQNQASRHRWLLTAAAAIVLTIVAGVALIQNTRDDAPTQIGPSPSVPVPSTTSPPTTIPTVQTQLFTEVAPDTMVTLPPAPIDAPQYATAVWSGTEVITWGASAVGAAFNPATGTWRITAPAPIDGRMRPAAVWTGTEMIVWGGDPFGDGFADGAAYNPTTDTWRRLPDAPLGPTGAPVAVWTGDEVVIFGAYHVGDAPTNDRRFGDTAAAAYNPATDEWRPLADLPGETSTWQAVWTGTTILAPATLADAEGALTTPVLARYDLGSDTWDIVDDEASYTALVGRPDRDGVARTVIALPVDTGAPITVLDSDGNSIGNLPGIPADGFGEHLSAVGVWAGEEALFWIHDGDQVFIPGDPFEGWALNPATKTWRPLPGNHLIPAQIGYTPGALVAAGDVVLAWGSKEGGADAPDVPFGVAYRAPTTATR